VIGVYNSWIEVRRKTRLSCVDKRSLNGCIRAQIELLSGALY
jgi:hypothetical protein